MPFSILSTGLGFGRAGGRTGPRSITIGAAPITINGQQISIGG